MGLSFSRDPRPGVQVHRIGSESTGTVSQEEEIYQGDLETPRVTPAGVWVRVESVRILPNDNEDEKRPTFRLQLSLDSDSQLSSQLRRTGTVSGLELDVEEKELAPLSRLSGRRVKIGYWLNTHVLDREALLRDLEKAEKEIDRLKHKLRGTQDQLQMFVENQIKETR